MGGRTRADREQAGAQVISARLPTALAEELLAEATRRNIKPSGLIRQAVHSFLHGRPGHIAGISASCTGPMRLVTHLDQYRTENINPVVGPAEPPQVTGVGLPYPVTAATPPAPAATEATAP